MTRHFQRVAPRACKARRAAVMASMVALAVPGCGGGGSSAPGSAPASEERAISPVAVNAQVSVATEANVAINPSPDAVPANRLFVFLAGTDGLPQNYRYILRAGAARGYHALGLNYPNDEAVGSICLLEPSPCFWDVRQEIVTGSDSSHLVSISNTDAIVTRLAETLAYLKTNFPDEGWSQFLLSDGSVAWSRVVVGGHSQGGGHAGVMAKMHSLAGACYFAAPADWSVAANAAAPWLARPAATPVSRQFGFSNVDDTLVPYDRVSAIWSALGLPGSAVSVDTVAPPYGNSHQLTTAVPGSGNQPSPTHGSPVLDASTPLRSDGVPVFEAVWAYACFR